MKPSANLIEAATTVMMCMAYKQTIEPIVTQYQKEILEKHRFLPKYDERLKNDVDFKQPVLNPDHLYTIADEDFNTYLVGVHQKHLENGFNVEFGYCPLLMARNMESDAHRELLEEAKYITKLDPQDSICSGMDNYKQAIELTMKWVGQFVDKKRALEIFDKEIITGRIKNKKSPKY